jgi:RNA polymerase sigma-70 factor (ECF subfamily)
MRCAGWGNLSAISGFALPFVFGYMRAPSDLPHPPDELEESRADDSPASAESLMRDFNQALVGMLQLRLGSYEDAREVAQEAYAKLLVAGDSKVVNYHRAYLFRIAQNLATDLLRKRAYTELPEPMDLGLWRDPVANPERAAQLSQVLHKLPAVLAELPDNCTEAFRLVRIKQLSFAEAAACMGLSERMVRIHVARALAHCQQHLDGITDEPAGEGHE